MQQSRIAVELRLIIRDRHGGELALADARVAQLRIPSLFFERPDIRQDRAHASIRFLNLSVRCALAEDLEHHFGILESRQALHRSETGKIETINEDAPRGVGICPNVEHRFIK